MTHPTILIATMLLVKTFRWGTDTVEEEAGQKKIEYQKDLIQIKELCTSINNN